MDGSPCFKVYKELYTKAHCKSTDNSEKGGLDLLASTALDLECGQLSTEERTQSLCTTSQDLVPGTSSKDFSACDIPGTSKETLISPAVREALVYPSEQMGSKMKRRRLVDNLDDHLTSEETIRKMSLKQIAKIKSLAEREKKAKLSFEKSLQTNKSKGEKKSSVHKKDKRKKTCSQKHYLCQTR